MDAERLNDLRYEYEHLFAVYNEPITAKQRHRVWNRLKEVLAESKKMLSEEFVALDGAEAKLSSLKIAKAASAVRRRKKRNVTTARTS